ncbi:trypsin-like cysteine/serine peptidase domain-containing protein [Immersiella caudata]|uniref:Trypsin-like cysteine/serine peptidase domain-containing protein n=1 Tax=Immersiella caudata TaxID=314043 RepID=A0AA39WJT7_9PEZI|nr:trypsin-like cysteine/serine peptidase domain-containing protein [Immersiella caudata]
MDNPTPPRDDEPRRRRDGDGPRTRGASSFSLFAVLLAILVVLIAILINLLGIGKPQKPKPDNGPIGVRIKYEDLLRFTEPYHLLYDQDLPPFHTMETRRFDTPTVNATCPGPTAPISISHVANSSARFSTIDPAQRACGIYPTVGKLTTSIQSCTGIMVWKDVVLTADHCLPWGRDRRVWESIKFTPAYDGTTPHPELYGSASAVRCAGVDPPLQDGRDMAVCKLNVSIGDACGKAKLGEPPAGWNAEWYKSRRWYSIGYPRSVDEGKKPQRHGSFLINDVKLINDNDGCHVLNTDFFADQGWSGGPVYYYDEATGKSSVEGVVINCEGPGGGPSGCSGATGTNIAAGKRMKALVEYGIVRSQVPSRWVFDAWNL